MHKYLVILLLFTSCSYKDVPTNYFAVYPHYSRSDKVIHIRTIQDEETKLHEYAHAIDHRQAMLIQSSYDTMSYSSSLDKNYIVEVERGMWKANMDSQGYSIWVKDIDDALHMNI